MRTCKPLFHILMLSLAVVAAGPAFAQLSASGREAYPSIECAGQYECVEDRPISVVEARASRSHPLQIEADASNPYAITLARDTCAACEQIAGEGSPR